MNRTRKVLLATLAGALLLFLLMEIFLRVAGGVVGQPEVVVATKPRLGDVERVVLLMGDSHTNGYSGHLREVVADEEREGNWRVVDGGRPGLNSAEVLRHLRRFLPRVQPEIVVILTGGTNSWNHSGYHQFAASKGAAGAESWFQEAVGRLRTVRLVRAIGAERKRRATGGAVKGKPDTRFFKDQAEQAGKAAKPPLRHKALPHAMFERYAVTEDLVPLIKRGEELSREDDLEQSLVLYKKVLETPEKFKNEAYLVELTVEVGWMISDLKRFADSFTWFRQAIVKYPKYDEPAEALFNLLIRLKEYDEVEIMFADLVKDRPELRRYPAMARHRKALSNDKWETEVAHWIKADLAAIVSLCRSVGARPIILSYPDDPDHTAMMREVARAKKAEFLDTHALIRGVLKRGGKAKEYLLPDGHCTPRGYRVIGEEVYRRFIAGGGR